MKIRESIQINAPASVVWQLVAHEFENVSTWASDVNQSKKTTNFNLLEGADVSGRVCTSQYGDIVEAFIHFDEANMTFTYDAKGDAVPFFIKRTTNTWTVEAIEEKTCIVYFQPEVEFIPIMGLFVGLPMRMFMRTVLQKTLEELKHYVETGSIHPRKQHAISQILNQTKVNSI